tara:strand:+ start:62 stop:652 length:591 start_codon:yes stop_codon:yes gene_type:complete
MLTAHKNNKNNNFIAGWYIEDSFICDNMIDFFEQNSDYVQRGGMNGGKIDLNRKNSFDLSFNSNDNEEPLISYKKNLSKVLELYKDKYKYCSKQQKEWGLYERYNIQKYPKGGGYPGWHTENDGFNINRHLVFTTYLNDVVEKGGETEFMYQKLKIKPEKGLTLIWPATWEYTHRGNICKNQIKYIATGWYSYRND